MNHGFQLEKNKSYGTPCCNCREISEISVLVGTWPLQVGSGGCIPSRFPQLVDYLMVNSLRKTGANQGALDIQQLLKPGRSGCRIDLFFIQSHLVQCNRGTEESTPGSATKNTEKVCISSPKSQLHALADRDLCMPLVCACMSKPKYDDQI